ncbi:hypothetical protein ACHHYP_17124 [Achlya hypogyna]|uniref:Uncharacterized protein n=1 Tax=Achlya hypogyna TaxID=1202772 RepID=A0A1V9Y558_ACHHY|nr:hypothetical protein ACHHYP_17124 [Achlya hypogyna]
MSKRLCVEQNLAPELVQTIALMLSSQHDMAELLGALPSAQLSAPLVALRALFVAFFEGRLGAASLWPSLHLPTPVSDASILDLVASALPLYPHLALSWATQPFSIPAMTTLALTLCSPQEAVLAAALWPHRLVSLHVTVTAWTDEALSQLCESLPTLPALTALQLRWQRATGFASVLDAVTASRATAVDLIFGRDRATQWDAGIVAAMAQWIELQPVTSLGLTYVHVDELSVRAMCNALHRCPTLRKLSIDQGDLAREWFYHQRAAPTLHTLTVAGCRYADLPAIMTCLAGANIASLGLNFRINERRKDDELLRFVAETLPTLPHLTSVDLPHYVFCPASYAAIGNLLPRLAEVNFETGQLKTLEGAMAIASVLPQCHRLASFKVSSLSAGGAAVAAGLTNCVNLTHVTLRGSRLGANGAAIVATAMASLHALVELNLSSNDMGDDGALSLVAAIPTCKRLVDVNLKSNHITCVGAASLANVLPQLVSLELGLNQISGAGARAIGHRLPRCNSLTWLGLHYNPLTLDGALAIIAGLSVCPRPWRRAGLSYTVADDADVARAAIARLAVPSAVVF